MVKNKKSRSRKSLTVPVAVVVPAAAVGYQVYKYLKAGDTRQPVKMFTGYDMATGSFNPTSMMAGLGPIVAGALVHKFAGPVVNKQLANAKIPYIRL